MSVIEGGYAVPVLADDAETEASCVSIWCSDGGWALAEWTSLGFGTEDSYADSVVVEGCGAEVSIVK